MSLTSTALKREHYIFEIIERIDAEQKKIHIVHLINNYLQLTSPFFVCVQQ